MHPTRSGEGDTEAPVEGDGQVDGQVSNLGCLCLCCQLEKYKLALLGLPAGYGKA